jgi:hypothetical protein
VAHDLEKLEEARTRGTQWGVQVAAAVIPVVAAHGSAEVLRQALSDVNVEVQRLAEELAAREGQAVALVWREAAVEALRCELLAFDALCESGGKGPLGYAPRMAASVGRWSGDCNRRRVAIRVGAEPPSLAMGGLLSRESLKLRPRPNHVPAAGTLDSSRRVQFSGDGHGWASAVRTRELHDRTFSHTTKIGLGAGGVTAHPMEKVRSLPKVIALGKRGTHRGGNGDTPRGGRKRTWALALSERAAHAGHHERRRVPS